MNEGDTIVVYEKHQGKGPSLAVAM
uniref:Uncharacterized protein n=1 Tax=Arundo donax TaxID=35708 RepID=A0A0A9HA06_ARUDO